MQVAPEVEGLGLEDDRPLPLILRLNPNTLALGSQGMPQQSRGVLDRFALASLPLDSTASSPSRVWHAGFRGPNLSGFIRGRLETQDGAPTVIFESFPSGPEGVSAGNPGEPRSLYTVRPIPEGFRTTFIHHRGRPIAIFRMSGWFGDGIDLSAHPLREAPPFSVRFYTGQEGERLPSRDAAHFWVGSNDLPVYNARRG